MDLRLFAECDSAPVVLKLSDEPHCLIKRFLDRYALRTGILLQHRLNIPDPHRRQSIARKCRPHFHPAQLSDELEFSHGPKPIRGIAMQATKTRQLLDL